MGRKSEREIKGREEGRGWERRGKRRTGISHTFKTKVPPYLQECRSKVVLTVRCAIKLLYVIAVIRSETKVE